LLAGGPIVFFSGVAATSLALAFSLKGYPIKVPAMLKRLGTFEVYVFHQGMQMRIEMLQSFSDNTGAELYPLGALWQTT